MDIIEKAFTRSVLGYDDAQVDAFLDQLALEIDKEQTENANFKQENERLKMALTRLTEEVSRLGMTRQKITGIEKQNNELKEEIQKLMVLSKDTEELQRMSDKKAKQIIAQAEKQSADIIQRSEIKATDIVREAESKAKQIIELANNDAEKMAKNVQDRERQIMDRAQQRAKAILETATAKMAKPAQKPATTDK